MSRCTATKFLVVQTSEFVPCTDGKRARIIGFGLHSPNDPYKPHGETSPDSVLLMCKPVVLWPAGAGVPVCSQLALRALGIAAQGAAGIL